MEMINEYLIQDALVIIPALLIIGKFLKETPKVKVWTIPYILLVLGIVLAVTMLGFNVDAIVQGILVSGAAVFGHQLYKQAKEGAE